MLTQEHPLPLLNDYVLDLLAPGDRRQVERHLQRCAHCRRLVRQDRAMVHDIRQTLHVASQPPVARLARLMPPAAQLQQRKRLETMLRPVLVLAILILLFAGSLNMVGPDAGNDPLETTPTALAATATLTPTSTIEPARNSTALLSHENRLQSPARPVATPVVALFAIAHN